MVLQVVQADNHHIFQDQVSQAVQAVQAVQVAQVVLLIFQAVHHQLIHLVLDFQVLALQVLALQVLVHQVSLAVKLQFAFPVRFITVVDKIVLAITFALVDVCGTIYAHLACTGMNEQWLVIIRQTRNV